MIVQSLTELGVADLRRILIIRTCITDSNNVVILKRSTDNFKEYFSTDDDFFFHDIY